MSADSANVVHQPEQHRFVIVADGAEALLEYRMLSPQVIDFVHTYTPASLRGQGVAGKLVSVGVAYARAQGWRVMGRCSYVAQWLSNHPT